MAELVGGFLMPHDPLIMFAPDAAPEPQKANVMRALDTIRRRIGELDATTVVVIGSEHYEDYGPSGIPTCLIGIGDLFAPAPKRSFRKVPNNEPLANHIMNTGFDEGVDWAVARSLDLDHSIALPGIYSIFPNTNVATIPIYLANAIAPTIRPDRAVALGQMLRRAIDSFSGNDRVVVVGSGGISHHLGTEKIGQVDEAFDRKVIDLFMAQDLEALQGMSDEEIIASGGNGALEIRNLMCALAAAPEANVKLIAYEPVPEWITGLGFLELEMAAA